MQDPPNTTYPTTPAEMEIYRYLSAGAGGGGEGLFGFPGAVNNCGNYYGGFTEGPGGNYSGSSCSSFYPSAGVITEATESRAVAASRVLHKEAEKRRRERINSHLDRLRSLLPCTSKTDKATLLSKVVQRVLELKRQTSHLLDEPPAFMIPSETDEFAVYVHNESPPSYEEGDEDGIGSGGGCGGSGDIDTECDNNNNNNNNNKAIMKAILCCDDRPDLFADLNQALSSLNLRTVRAEISTLGGRIQGVLLVTGDDLSDECAVFLRDALKGVVQRSGSDERLKRRRTRVFDPNGELAIAS